MAKVNSSTSSDSAIVEINVIPLVDIILVVLIIFMVSAPLVNQPKIDINLPKASSAKEEPDQLPMRLVLGKNGEVFLNDKAITIDKVLEEARRQVSSRADVAALLVADKDSTLEMVTELVDAVKTGGVKKVAFSIQKK